MNPPAANNQYWLLNSVTGWGKGAHLRGLLENADGSLTLQTLPGEAQPFGPDLAGKVTCPAALARDECGQTYVLDAAADRIVRIEPSGQVQTIADFGGPGSEPRQLRTPR